jgi:hypothetical protein
MPLHACIISRASVSSFLPTPVKLLQLYIPCFSSVHCTYYLELGPLCSKALSNLVLKIHLTTHIFTPLPGQTVQLFQEAHIKRNGEVPSREEGRSTGLGGESLHAMCSYRTCK